jgi:hypothetical protein
MTMPNDDETGTLAGETVQAAVRAAHALVLHLGTGLHCRTCGQPLAACTCDLELSGGEAPEIGVDDSLQTLSGPGSEIPEFPDPDCVLPPEYLAGKPLSGRQAIAALEALLQISWAALGALPAGYHFVLKPGRAPLGRPASPPAGEERA